MRFKKNKIWLATHPDGKPVVKDGKVLIKYQLDQDYEYWVNAKGVKSIDAPAKDREVRQNKASGKSSPGKDKSRRNKQSLEAAPREDVVCIYTDGASAGNPGPSGIGVVLRYGKHQKEISEYIGRSTNNIAELKAIYSGLSALKNRDLPVRIFTDSKYAYGLLALGWQPRKNQELVKSIKNLISKFKNLKFVKVKGHAGQADNERADLLATSAIKLKGSASK